MVMDLMSGSGSNGMDPNSGVMKLFQQKMLAEMFGIAEHTEPVDLAAEVVGLDPNGSFGVLGVRLMPPTPTQPFPVLQLETNGKLSIRPKDLKALQGFFHQISERFETGYAEQQEAAKKMEGYELFGAMIGANTGK